jgi:uncharacterized protein YcbK (DUF882 family)
VKITENFHRDTDKMYCPCCKGFPSLDAVMPLMRKVQAMRTLMAIPFTVNSFYRCREHNDSLPNSSKDSQHVLGNAIDISCKSWSGAQRREFERLALFFGLSIGHYPTFYHLDLRSGEPVSFHGK